MAKQLAALSMRWWDLEPKLTKVWPDLAALRKWTQAGQRFTPALDEGPRRKKIERWRRAVAATIAFYRD